jgi:hypothetical protein
MPWDMHAKEYGLCILARRAKEEFSVKRLIECHQRECRNKALGQWMNIPNLSSGLAWMYYMLDGVGVC